MLASAAPLLSLPNADANDVDETAAASRSVCRATASGTPADSRRILAAPYLAARALPLALYMASIDALRLGRRTGHESARALLPDCG